MDNKKSEITLFAINIIFIAVIIIFNIVTAPPITKHELTFETYARETTTTIAIQTQITENENDINALININSASLDELKTLDGIGDTKAQAIIDYRNTNGDFTSVDDLINVEGIGEITLEKIKPHLTIY